MNLYDIIFVSKKVKETSLSLSYPWQPHSAWEECGWLSLTTINAGHSWLYALYRCFMY
jgi:hypothetical protein